jgi:hypothetical protein
MTRSLPCFVVAMAAAAAASAITPSYEVVVPAAVRGAGGGGSVWQLDLFLSNLGDATASVSVYWLERNHDNTQADPVALTIDAGRSVVLEDALMGLFSMTSAAGAIRLVSTEPLGVNSYIYNLDGGVRFGQGFEGLPVSHAANALTEVVIPGLREDGANRSNLFGVAGPAGASIRVVVMRLGGAVVGQRTVDLMPFSAWYQSIAGLVSGAPGNVVASIEVLSGSAWLVGSRVDNQTGDPFTAGAVTGSSGDFTIADMAGSYTGSWLNLSFGSSGPASATVVVDQVSRTVDLTLDLDGNVLGGANPPPETFTGPYDSTGFSVSGSSSVFGDVSFRVDVLGRLEGRGADIPNPAIDDVVFSGSASPDTIAMDYVVLFAGGGGTAQGILTMTR